MACQMAAKIHNGRVATPQQPLAQRFRWRDPLRTPVQKLSRIGRHLDNTGRHHGRLVQPWFQALGDSEPLLLSRCRGRSGKYWHTCRSGPGRYELTTIQDTPFLCVGPGSSGLYPRPVNRIALVCGDGDFACVSGTPHRRRRACIRRAGVALPRCVTSEDGIPVERAVTS